MPTTTSQSKRNMEPHQEVDSGMPKSLGMDQHEKRLPLENPSNQPRSHAIYPNASSQFNIIGNEKVLMRDEEEYIEEYM